MRQSPLRLWQRLSVRMVAAFVLVTVFAIGLAALLLFRGLADVPLLGRLEAVRDFQGLHQVLEEVVSDAICVVVMMRKPVRSTTLGFNCWPKSRTASITRSRVRWISPVRAASL